MSADRIRKLPPALINKIAAGEVVERPASVIKELVENAIDAEASRIEITIEDGGKRLIRVTDNGVGMTAGDLALACESHATSKLPDPDDLFEIHTLGFRGEALASIGAISHCRIVSRPRGADIGAAIEANGGRPGQVKSCGAPEGTIIEVRNLFFNTPARLKFLRATATELRHIVEAVTRLALPYPGIGVQLTHNDRSHLKLQPCATQRERLGALLGDSLCAQLLPVHAESAAMTLLGFVSAPGAGRSAPTQYVFLNGRYIRDRAIHRAIAEAYRNRLPKGRYPVICLYLQLDPARVDVNVHPTKIEVRFRDSGAVFAQILTALEKTLARSGPTPAPAQRAQPAKPTTLQSSIINHQSSIINQKSEIRNQKSEIQPPQPPISRRCTQIHNTYILEETDNGFLLIDQHALHERILYEDLIQRLSKAAVPRQRLLMPELIDLPAADYERIIELKDELLPLGVEIEAFGEKTVAVQAVPHLAGSVNPRELLLDILSELEQTPAGRTPERADRIVQTIACKAAVKAGDRLSRTQIENLLDRRDQLGPEPTCPHGRPTTIHFTAHQLAKMFRRK